MTTHCKSWIGWSAVLLVVGSAHSALAQPNFAMIDDPEPRSAYGQSSPRADGADNDVRDGRYGELRLAFGVGGNNSAREVDAADGTEGQGVISIDASFLTRRGWAVFGATGSLGGELFGGQHTYLGAVAGYAVPSQGNAHIELLAEGGAHMLTGVGEGLFVHSSGDNSAVLPYLGAQARISVDPGVVEHLAFDLAVAGRFDVTRTENQVDVESCFMGCDSSTETWALGGQSVDLSLGLRYLF